ncbi:3-keto-disaccharide hydrolase [Flavobacterium sp. MAHUQ-51]|uniref:3-keto-disaccharide hydrolase n=1 Tax=Flavobacterium sp. GCM10022190 TaxID=3252639 RepID=UPI003609C8E3
MKNIFATLILMIMIQTANGQIVPRGFKLLFDGKTTTGWHNYGKKTVGTAWKIEDGILHYDPSAAQNDQGGDLVTDLEYENFHLKLEWKVAKNSNSGIIFYVNEDVEKFKHPYETGLEMQILDNDGHPDGKIEKHRAGDLYDLIKSSSEPVKAVGEWNSVDIVCKFGKLTMLLNGIKVVETTLWDDNFKKLVAGSKFSNWPGFAAFKKGKIALQDHGDNVWYRNIMIKEWNTMKVTTGCEVGM